MPRAQGWARAAVASRARIMRCGALIARESDDEGRLWLDLDADGQDAPTQMQGAAIRYRIAAGPIAGRKTLRLRTPGARSTGRAGSRRIP